MGPVGVSVALRRARRQSKSHRTPASTQGNAFNHQMSVRRARRGTNNTHPKSIALSNSVVRFLPVMSFSSLSGVCPAAGRCRLTTAPYLRGAASPREPTSARLVVPASRKLMAALRLVPALVRQHRSPGPSCLSRVPESQCRPTLRGSA